MAAPGDADRAQLARAALERVVDYLEWQECCNLAPVRRLMDDPAQVGYAVDGLLPLAVRHHRLLDEDTLADVLWLDRWHEQWMESALAGIKQQRLGLLDAAHQSGARMSYTQIGAACDQSRQAAQQRHQRLRHANGR